MKIDPYNFELYSFKVGAFFSHSVDDVAGGLASDRLWTIWCLETIRATIAISGFWTVLVRRPCRRELH